MSVPSAPVEVRGEGVLLRAPRESDADRLLEAFGDSGTRLWNPGPQDRDGVLAWIAERADWSAGAHTSWLIAQPHDDDVLGSVSVWKIDLEQGDAEVGYWVAPWGRGRGVASSAVRAAAAYAFDELGLDRLHLFHAIENPASCGVARKAGFLLEGTLRQSYRYADGRHHDEHLHARLVTDD